MLSSRQQNAAHRLGQDVCVVAGPGSGKTSVLIERFAWLVQKRNVNPGRILAITFTEKAATEIRQRLLQEFNGDHERQQLIQRSWVSTIHAFCARLLRENAVSAGVDPSFSVLEQSFVTLREVADEVLESMFREEPQRMRSFLESMAVATERDGFVPDLASSLIEIYQAIRLADASVDDLLRVPEGRPERLARLREIAAAIAADPTDPRTDNQREQHRVAREWVRSAAAVDANEVTSAHIQVVSADDWNKNHLVKGSVAREHETERRQLCKELLSDFLLEYYKPERAQVAEALRQLDARYRERKRQSSMLDFDDLEEAAIHLLTGDAELRERVRGSFDFILMDELQDTNPLQWRLLELIRRPDRFFAVGDVNQSIYGFRHARPELFGGYRQSLERAGREIDELRDNYRSRPELLAFVNQIFTGAKGIEPHELTPGSAFPPVSAECVETMTIFGETSAETEEKEALWVARRIAELCRESKGGNRHVTYGDFAILTRANYSTAGLQHALDVFGIPSVVVGGLTFYDTREVKDLKLILDVLVNPQNEVALAGLMRSPVFGLSDEELFRRVLLHGSLAEAIRKDPPKGWDRIEELRKLRNVVSPDQLLLHVLDDCDYNSGLTQRGKSNVTKYLAMLRETYTRAPVPLAQLAAAVEQFSPESEAPPADFGDAVRLMTIHKAKGLEFPVVFLPFLHKGRSYGFPIISYTHQFGLGLKWRNPATGEGVGDAIWNRNRAAAVAAEDQEENRLLYVACTRAKQSLVLSWSVTGNERGAWSELISSKLGIDVESRQEADTRRSGVRMTATSEKPAVAAGSARQYTQDTTVTLARATIADGADSSASVTDISRFVECPRKFYLARYLGESRIAGKDVLRAEDEGETGPADDLTASELGVQVHSLLAGQHLPAASAEAHELARAFRESAIARKLERATRTEREWDFVLLIAGLTVRGQIDLWFEQNRKLTIVDYKTDRNPDPLTVEAHSVQLQIYSVALAEALKRHPDRAVLFFLRTQREHEVNITPLAVGAAINAIHSFRSAMHTREFPLNPGDHCRRCEFYGRQCPAGRH